MDIDRHGNALALGSAAPPRRSFTIGRDPACDVVLADETVGREHARLDVVGEEGRLVLSDCGQAPATKVVHRGEARAIRRAIVTLDDSVRFGDIEMSVPELIEALSYTTSIKALLPPAATPAQARGSAATPTPAKTPPASTLLLPCGRCGRMTDSLKRHRLHNWLVFVWLFWWAQTADYTACASCMRAILLQRTVVNIPAANLLWPIVLVVNAVYFVGTFRKGHGARVRKELLPG